MNPEFTQRLCDFATSQVGKPYSRPDTVCMSLALQGIDYATGTTFYSDNRRHFISAASMKSFVGGKGLEGLIAVMCEQGFEEINPAFATAGDIGFTGQGSLGIGAALLVGSNVMTSNPDQGVVICRIEQIELKRAVRLKFGAY